MSTASTNSKPQADYGILIVSLFMPGVVAQ